MALSEDEQRLFDEIEQSLIADDPKFASSGPSGRAPTTAQIVQGLSVIGMLLALGGIVFGLITASTVGFCVAGALVVLVVYRSWVALRARRQRHPRPPRAPN